MIHTSHTCYIKPKIKCSKTIKKWDIFYFDDKHKWKQQQRTAVKMEHFKEHAQ